MVLDAAIDPTKPLPWKQWLLKQVPTLSAVKVTVADSNAYTPYSLAYGSYNFNTFATLSQKYSFLKKEWDRQIELGRNPEQVLGNNPPWLHAFVDSHDSNPSITQPSSGLSPDFSERHLQ
jgi:hypothetical protein